MNTISSKAERIIAGFVLGVAFLVMASIIVPHDTQASESDRQAPARFARSAPLADGSVDAHAGLVEMGSIESSCYLVRIYGGGSQPLYTVFDIADGRELGTLLTVEQVESRFPDLPLSTIQFDGTNSSMLGPHAIMSADPFGESDFR